MEIKDQLKQVLKSTIWDAIQEEQVLMSVLSSSRFQPYMEHIVKLERTLYQLACLDPSEAVFYCVVFEIGGRMYCRCFETGCFSGFFDMVCSGLVGGAPDAVLPFMVFTRDDVHSGSLGMQARTHATKQRMRSRHMGNLRVLFEKLADPPVDDGTVDSVEIVSLALTVGSQNGLFRQRGAGLPSLQELLGEYNRTTSVRHDPLAQLLNLRTDLADPLSLRDQFRLLSVFPNSPGDRETGQWVWSRAFSNSCRFDQSRLRDRLMCQIYRDSDEVDETIIDDMYDIMCKACSRVAK